MLDSSSQAQTHELFMYTSFSRKDAVMGGALPTQERPQSCLLQESEGFIAMLIFCDQSSFSFEIADTER